MENQERIVLIPHGEPSHCEQVSTTLGDLGYSSRFNSIIPIPGSNISELQLLIILLGPKQRPDSQLLNYLRMQNTNPTLCIPQSDFSINLGNKLINYCDDFVSWPSDYDEFALRVARLVPPALTEELLQEEILEQFVKLNLIGQSESFQNVLVQLKNISKCDAPVLIEGETGTGKEMAARAVHYLSDRRDCPFIPVNCGALPDSLLENELFGHEKGAYTDAKNSQCGLISQAHKGSLFLDEIDSLSQKAQVALLRFLQDKRYIPLGGQSYKEADVRIIAASNQSLEEKVKQGQFRTDLFYRLNILYVYMPPLRDRPGDAILLAKYFMCQLRAEHNQLEKCLSPQALQKIRNSQWSGNVRELENYVYREFWLPSEVDLNNTEAKKNRRRGVIDRRQRVQYDLTFNRAKEMAIEEFENAYLRYVMDECNGNVSAAAVRAGKERRCLGKLLKKHNINKISTIDSD